MAMIDDAERRARLGVRHFLARRAKTVEIAADGVAGLHSSDPATVFLAARARVKTFAVSDLEEVLYERRSLVRMLGMRRTMFVVSPEFAAAMDAACTQPIATKERVRLIGLIEDQGIAKDGERWLARVERRTLDALAELGEATASQLSEAIPELRHKLHFGEGKRWAGTMGMSTRVLFLLAANGQVVRGRPLGSWISSQYRWARTEVWLGRPLPQMELDQARGYVARRWLRTFGPGTVNDMKWWTGWTVRQTKATLDEIGAVAVGLESGEGYVLPDDVKPTRPPPSWVALLPGLDPTVMGWKDRDWYLGEKGPQLFDSNGNAGPTIVVDGRVVGTWAQKPDGTVTVGLLERVGRNAQKLIDAEIEQLRVWLGDVRVTPRFPTPFERSLRDGQES